MPKTRTLSQTVETFRRSVAAQKFAEPNRKVGHGRKLTIPSEFERPDEPFTMYSGLLFIQIRVVFTEHRLCTSRSEKSFFFLLCLPVSLPRRAENFSADNPVINEPKINEATSEESRFLSARIS